MIFVIVGQTRPFTPREREPVKRAVCMRERRVTGNTCSRQLFISRSAHREQSKVARGRSPPLDRRRRNSFRSRNGTLTRVSLASPLVRASNEAPLIKETTTDGPTTGFTFLRDYPAPSLRVCPLTGKQTKKASGLLFRCDLKRGRWLSLRSRRPLRHLSLGVNPLLDCASGSRGPSRRREPRGERNARLFHASRLCVLFFK